MASDSLEAAVPLPTEVVAGFGTNEAVEPEPTCVLGAGGTALMTNDHDPSQMMF